MLMIQVVKLIAARIRGETKSKRVQMADQYHQLIQDDVNKLPLYDEIGEEVTQVKGYLPLNKSENMA